MNAEDVIYALLTGAGAVTAIVSTRVYPVLVPQGVQLAGPTIAYELVSSARVPAIDATAPTHTTRSRVQVDLIAPEAGWATLRQLRDAVVGALQHQRGAIAGVAVHAVLLAFEGPVTFDQQLGLWHRPLDFMVHHQS